MCLCVHFEQTLLASYLGYLLPNSQWSRNHHLIHIDKFVQFVIMIVFNLDLRLVAA